MQDRPSIHTRFFYDKKGNKVREVDPQNREALFEYDQHGELLRRTDPLGNATVFTYNADGKLLSQTDAEGKVVRYEGNIRDGLARMLYLPKKS